MLEDSLNFILARAKSQATGEEVIGYICDLSDAGRQSYTQILLPETNENSENRPYFL